jgi:acyl-coenzyme A thioesterase PaaI-like protein
MPLELEDDFMCYVCGKENGRGLHLRFEHPEKGKLTAKIVFEKHHQGFKNIVHGGMMAMVLDEMMVNLAWKEGIPAVTGELTVRLKKAAKIGETIHLEGRIEKEEGRLVYASSKALDASGQLLASAKATCVRIKGGDKILRHFNHS